MNIKCMLLLACFTAIAVPTESLPMPRHHKQSLMRPKSQPMKPIAVAPPTPPRLKLPRPLPLLRPLPRARILISPRSTPVLSAKTTAPTASKNAPLRTAPTPAVKNAPLRTAPTPAVKNAPLRTAPTPAVKKVEQFAKKLRDDMDKQESVLNAFITTIKQKHEHSKLKLSRVNLILKGLKDQIANATRFADKYQAEVNAQTGQDKIILEDYEKSHKMFSEEQANIEFEKKFLEEIIKYIQMRRTQKC